MTLLLSGCGMQAAEPSVNPNNICSVFEDHPSWYWASLSAYKKWGLPVSVQMAIVRQESSFRGHAQPPRNKLLGVIPWSRPSTAYGYSQALNGVWEEYKSETKHPDAERDSFADAMDFMGWYASKVSNKLGISKRDAYNQYLAYHEGMTGYQNGTYKQQPWLMEVAKSVQTDANIYRKQLLYCYQSLPQPGSWNRWFNH